MNANLHAYGSDPGAKVNRRKLLCRSLHAWAPNRQWPHSCAPTDLCLSDKQDRRISIKSWKGTKLGRYCFTP